MKTEDGVSLDCGHRHESSGEQKSEGEGEADSDKEFPDRQREVRTKGRKKTTCAKLLAGVPRQAVVFVQVQVMASE